MGKRPMKTASVRVVQRGKRFAVMYASSSVVLVGRAIRCKANVFQRSAGNVKLVTMENALRYVNHALKGATRFSGACRRRHSPAAYAAYAVLQILLGPGKAT